MESRDAAKARASKLRTILHELGHDISHANALEVIARQYNFKNWNTCSATLSKRETILGIPHGWQISGDHQERYDIGIDQSLTYGGTHPAVIRYKETSPKDGTGFATLMQSFQPTEYCGKRIRLSGSIKCEDCDGAVTLWLRADSNNRRAIAFDNLEDKGINRENGPITGTTDWIERNIVLDVPEEATSLSFGFYLRGRGAGYAAGFNLDEVATNIPATTSPINEHDKPVNMNFRGNTG